ncbi:DUF1775 domain-containing protein [Actinoplanes palleronii]|uniref:DUF1775 domain-containing protein n=1 Tax=Actinoplanes palleronii TaxID=113570 RepID=UPI0019406425|nr:DUF1775 domain-containing protein [Actinoplanes palleronii]
MGTALTVVATTGILGVAGPAFADVTVSPTSAPQGSGQNAYYHYTNEGTQPIAKVTLEIPKDTPIAEVYPLSTDDWAPKIEWQDLNTPLKTIHNGTPVTQVPLSITWIAVAGKAIAPGGSADLGVAVGPLPTLSTVSFTLVGTYADGKAAAPMTATMALTPDPDGAAAAAHHAATGGGATTTEDEDQFFAQAIADAEQNDRGASVLGMAGWVVAALALLGAGWVVLRNRHRSSDEPEEPDEVPGPEAEAAPEDDDGSDKEPVEAGRWSFRG